MFHVLIIIMALRLMRVMRVYEGFEGKYLISSCIYCIIDFALSMIDGL